MRHYERDWDELAQREPYYAVLTDERFLRGRIDDEARKEFFESGERDVNALLAAIGEFHGRSALDFGCGVGRLTLPLSKRFQSVVGFDVSRAMIEIAQQNVPAAEFVTSLDDIRDRTFDVICSLIVFQHIPVRDGLERLGSLLRLLAPDGVALLHFTLRRPGGPLRRLARRLRGTFPILHRVAGKLRGDRHDLPYMQMNEYDEEEIQRRILEATGAPAAVLPRREGDIEGAIFLVRGSHRAKAA